MYCSKSLLSFVSDYGIRRYFCIYVWRIVDGIVNDYCMKIFYEFSTHNERQQGKGMLKPHKPKRTLYIIVNALLIALLYTYLR